MDCKAFSKALAETIAIQLTTHIASADLDVCLEECGYQNVEEIYISDYTYEITGDIGRAYLFLSNGSEVKIEVSC